MTTTLKIAASLALVYWLVSQGKLDASSLRSLRDNPSMIFVNISYFLIGPAFLCMLRWHQLLRGMGFMVTRFDTMRLNLIGLFFNAIMPGAVGGDIVKALYVCQGKDRESKVQVLLTLLIDRVLGLAALLFISLVSLIWGHQVVFSDPNLTWIAGLVTLAFFGMVAMLFFAMFPDIAKRFPILGLGQDLIMRIRIVASLYQAMANYRQRPQYLLSAFGFGVLFQLLNVAFYTFVSVQLAHESFSMVGLITILPVALSITALPLSPGGLGVGHLGFQHLYSMIGLSDGANIFNLVFVCQLLLSLTGSVFYVFSKFPKEVLVAENEETPVSSLCP